MDAPARKGSDVVVVGGGAIGLAVARALAGEGASVTVLDRGRPGEQATRAAGGMLSPLAEAHGPGPFLALGVDSLALWPGFAGALEEQTGVALDLRTDGKLLLALDEGAAARLRERAAWIQAAGFAATWLDPEAVRAREPGAAAARAALHIEADGQVDNRALGAALTAAAGRAGCLVRSGTAAHALVAVGGRVRAVRVAGGAELGCDTVVLAGGAWSGALAGLPRALPVRPIKGQMIALASARPPRTTVETDACYLIPRPGAVWVGATSEDVGFARGTTDAARAGLRAAAGATLPELAHAPELEAWDGFRPATPDGLPVLGPDPELGGLVHANGHFRNGILLTPITAALVARAVRGDRDPRLEAFRADRFAR